MPTREVEHAPIQEGFQLIGDPSVISSLWKNKQELDEGHLPSRRVALILPGGGQRGVREGALVSALEKFDMRNVFSDVVGISTGAPVGYYFLGGEAVRGTTIYTDDNVENGFVELKRIYNVMGLKRLEKVFREDKALQDLDKLYTSMANLWVGLTDAKTGKAEFKIAQLSDDPINLLMASINVPFLGKLKPRKIGDNSYWDGTIAAPLPIQWVIDNLDPTDILIGFNKPVSDKNHKHMLEQFTEATIKGKMFTQLKTVNERYNEEFRFVTGEKKSPVNIAGFIPLNDSLTTFSMDRRLLVHERDTCKASAIEILSQYRPVA